MAHESEGVKEGKAYKTRIDDMISSIKNNDVRTMLGIQSKSRLYPKDCITDGGLEKLVKYILSLEAQVGKSNNT